MKFAQLLVWSVGLVFVIYGLLFALAPTYMASVVTNAVPVTNTGLIDMRATYGGMSIAVGIILIALGVRYALWSQALLFSAITLVCMAAGRIIGMLIEGDAAFSMYVYFVLEVVGAFLALLVRGKIRSQ